MKAIPVIDIRKILVVVFTLFIAHTTSAQSKIDYSQLKLNDSIRIQTIYGSYYYGFFAGQTDSLLSLQISMISDTLRLAKNQIYELEVLARQIPAANAQQQQQAADKKQSPTLPPAPGTDPVVIKPPSGATMTLQVLTGGAGLIVGAIAGGIGGAIIGFGIGGSDDFGSTAAGLGAAAGGLGLSTLCITSLGDTKQVKGKFLKTMGGVVLGSIGTLPFMGLATEIPLAIILVPFVPALVGTLFYNSSRYIVPKPLGSGLLPPSPFSGPAYGMVGGRPVFQVNLLTLTF